MQELEEFEKDVSDAQRKLENLPFEHTEVTPIYFPARLTQARYLSENASGKSQIFEEHQDVYINEGYVHLMRRSIRNGLPHAEWLPAFGTPGGPQPEPHNPRWLDLTQVDINPYFSSLFGNRFSARDGRYDITIKDSTPNGLMDSSYVMPDVRNLVGSMFATNPPCRYLRLFMWTSEGGACGETMRFGYYSAEHLTVASDEAGIKVNALVNAIARHMGEAIDACFNSPRTLMQLVWEIHWKHDIWCLPNTPIISILLDNGSDPYDIYEQWTQLRTMTHAKFVKASEYRKRR